MAPRTVRTLGIRLSDIEVGHLSWFSDGRGIFQFAESYQLLGSRRPILSLSFIEPGSEEKTLVKLAQPYARTVRLPSYFRNLLPEGALREWMARKVGTTPTDEFGLLEGLGRNLPGAILAEREAPPASLKRSRSANPSATEDKKAPVLFSLGGAQLKVTMLKEGKGFVMIRKPSHAPASEWIIKPPHPTFPRVPENEFGMLTFAKAIGIDTPEAELVPLKDLDLGNEIGHFARGEKLAYAIKRFDRADDARRVHTEDFAQVFGVDPEDEYIATNYDTLGNLIFQVFPDPFDQLAELVRRLTFMIIIGNSDAHLKNWSVLYADGRTPRLSPAYDLVSTIQYVPSNRKLALNIRREKEFARISLDHFARMSKRIGVAPDFVIRVVEETVSRSREAWPSVSRKLPKELVTSLKEHWRDLDGQFRL